MQLLPSNPGVKAGFFFCTILLGGGPNKDLHLRQATEVNFRMNKDELEEQILKFCHEDDNFALKVRVHCKLDWENYAKLRSLLYKYVEAVKHDKHIRREIFGCVYGIDAALQGALNHWVTPQHPERQRVSLALGDIEGVLIAFMAPPATE
jgi:hypothetical protein